MHGTSGQWTWLHKPAMRLVLHTECVLDPYTPSRCACAVFRRVGEFAEALVSELAAEEGVVAVRQVGKTLLSNSWT